MNKLTVRHVAARCGQRLVLDGVCLHVRKGEFVGLLGANGSGKSTLLRTLAGLRKPDQGVVMLGERPLVRYKSKELAKMIGYVPQDISCDFDFTVREIVRMGRHPHTPRFRAESPDDRAAVRRALRQTQLLELSGRSVRELSGGQRQMVFIAKALAQEPELLLLDEPISALDIRHQLQVLELIRLVAGSGTASVAALHDLNLAARYCDRLVLLAEGRVLADGRPKEVLTEARIRMAYGVKSRVHRDDLLGAVQVTALEPDHEPIHNREGETVESAQQKKAAQ